MQLRGAGLWLLVALPGIMPRIQLGAQSIRAGAVPLEGSRVAAVGEHRWQESEVRQIVTFLFLPGRSAEGLRVYQDRIKPIYEGIGDLLRFRAYREVESPEPFDFFVVSTYRGMDGMDRANAGLRTPGPAGESAAQLYGHLSSMTQHHHDQFVEMIPALGDVPAGNEGEGAGLTVFEYLRVTPGSREAFEEGMASVRRSERAQRLYTASETGRMLVSDGWDFVRIHQIPDLGSWQKVLATRRSTADLRESEQLVAARKVLIVRVVPGLSVR